MGPRSWIVALVIAGTAASAGAEAPRGIAGVLKRMSSPQYHRILPQTSRNSFYLHRAGSVQAGDRKLTVMWGPRKPTQIQETNAKGWVRRVVVKDNWAARKLYNLKSRSRARDGFAVGGPPVDVAVSSRDAAQILRQAGFSGRALNGSFRSMLKDVSRPGNPFGYQSPQQ